MKKILYLAAAAAMMVSCMETEKIGNDLQEANEQNVIGFASYSEKATRGDATDANNLEFYHGTFTVYGSKKSTIDDAISEVFDGGATALLTYSNGATTPNDWTYSPYRFWDKQANYKFIAVAPNASVVKYDWNAKDQNLVEVGTEANDFVTVEGGYTLIGQNLQKTATSNEITKGFTGGNNEDTDIMTSGVVSEVGATHNTDVNLTFKHILAKLNVTVAKAYILNDAEVYIKSIEIAGLKDKGTYDESKYHLNAGQEDLIATKSGWTAAASDNAANYKLAYSYAEDDNKYEKSGRDPEGQVGAKLADATSQSVKVPTYFIESLVMPQAVAAQTSTLTIKYQIVTGTGEDAHAEDFTRTFDMNQAFASYLDRHNYTLNFTIEPDVITFDAAAALWADGGTVNKTIE